MKTFIFLGYIPVPGWQHKIDFVTKAVQYLTKKYLYSGTEKKQKNSPLKGCHLGFSSKKSGNPWGGGVCCTALLYDRSILAGVFFYLYAFLTQNQPFVVVHCYS